MTRDQIAQLERLIAAGIELSNLADFLRNLPTHSLISKALKARARIACEMWDKQLSAAADARTLLRRVDGEP